MNEVAYGYAEPKMAPAIAAPPPTVLTYGDDKSVASAYEQFL
jgi:hypothetical protein